MKTNQSNPRRFILKLGVGMSLILLAMVALGWAGWAEKGSSVHEALPVAAGLAFFNLLGCIAGLRK